MGIKTDVFGKTAEGTQVYKITLCNDNGMKVSCINYGANIVSIEVPDKSGKTIDVCLGFDSVEEYEVNPPFFGAFIGRCANRVGGASFTINGNTYQLAKNEKDKNTLHSGAPFYHKVMYDYRDVSADGVSAVCLSRLSPDMEQGFPGNLDVSVTYSLTNDNELIIEYGARSDKDTVVNFTNHSYFNLDGNASGNVENHKVYINAEKYTATTSELIPTGELADIKGTPLDFTSEKRVGEDIDKDMDTLKYGKGYDLNYAINKPLGEFGLAARAKGENGLVMEVYTDLPGVQFYTGNNIGAGLKGKADCTYGPRSGLCFETQQFPNACNIDSFPSCILKAGEKFVSKTMYKFL